MKIIKSKTLKLFQKILEKQQTKIQIWKQKRNIFFLGYVLCKQRCQTMKVDLQYRVAK